MFFYSNSIVFVVLFLNEIQRKKKYANRNIIN